MSITTLISPTLFLRPPSLTHARTKTFPSPINGVSTRKKQPRPKSPLLCNAQLAELAPAASAVYGSLLLGGGLFAFSRSGSKGSLAGGVSGAVLMATAYWLMQVPETKDVGDAIGFGSALIFSAVFGIRLAATRKFVPAGPLMGLSIFASIVFILAYLQDRI